MCFKLFRQLPTALKDRIAMKSRLSTSDEEDEFQSTKTSCYWWRLTPEFTNDCVNLLNLNIASLSPRLRVLRELERLASVADKGISEIRYQLAKYRSGGFWVPTGGIKREGMDIPPVITILLLGFCGSGKSSLVNLMCSVLGRSGFSGFAQTSSGSGSNYTTMYLEEHNIMRSNECGFCVYDSRGFNYNAVDEAIEEVSNWMANGVHHNQLCIRPSDGSNFGEEANAVRYRSSSKFAKRTVNCVMVVVNLAEVYKAEKSGDLRPLEAIRALFCSSALRKYNENPILILTHGDLLTAEERIEGRLKLCERLGVLETSGAFDIVCLTELGLLVEESDPVTACALGESVYRALVISDMGHLPKQDYQDWTLFILSRLMCLLGALFAFLADVCSNIANERLKQL